MGTEAKRGGRRRVIVWGVVLTAFGVVVALRAFLFTPAYVSSRSMEPSLRPGDIFLIHRGAFGRRLPAPGEVVALQTLDRKEVWVKRVVAGPGDMVELRGGVLYRNGLRVEEPYVRTDPTVESPRQRVPDGHVWVLGDNRPNSEDSRSWGPLRRDFILGKAAVICWPTRRAGRLR